MKVTSADITLESSQFSLSRFQSSERLEMWTGDRGNRGPGRNNGIGAIVREIARPEVRLSKEALAAQEADATREASDAVDDDPRMQFLRQIIEALTGRPVRTLSPEDLGGKEGASRPAPTEQPPAPGQSRAARSGFGLEYDFRASYQEYERTDFRASGVIQTSDGQKFEFQLELTMERFYAESVSTSLRLGDARLKDPLVIDFAGPAAALSNMRFNFDLDADGTLDALPMLAGGRGFLAIDRNDNGRIDDGRELFGPASGNGFAELAREDSDGNGWLDESDPAYEKLRVWQPAADGPGVLTTARDAGIGALYLGQVATPFALKNSTNELLGLMRSSGVYLREDGSAGTVSQVDLKV